MSDSIPRTVPAFDPGDVVRLTMSGVECTGTVQRREDSPLLGGEWYVVNVAEPAPRPGISLARVDQLAQLATCRHCGAHGPAELHADDGTCPRCTLLDVLKGADDLADGEAVDAYGMLSSALHAFMDGKSADDITAAAFIDGEDVNQDF